ncbi:head protein [Pyxidicoccus trucidator]|uniref:head protein n=1 Tax=Pyxidicoccus trucidator TaxID=2709662 RepID=UPI001F075AA3|nr:head protein [Pyxidicoccus trucidator]
MKPGKGMVEVEALLGRLRHENQSPEEKDQLRIAMDLFEFLFETGQTYAFDEYRKSLDLRAPPLVTASFDTREEAMAWLKAHPNPPDGAKVLIAGEYHNIVYFRDLGERRLPGSPVLEFYLEDMARGGLPPPVATFDSYEEAKAWVDSQPEPPQQVFILIAGEYHLVAYHYRVNLRAIYPMSMAAKSLPEAEADD